MIFLLLKLLKLFLDLASSTMCSLSDIIAFKEVFKVISRPEMQGYFCLENEDHVSRWLATIYTGSDRRPESGSSANGTTTESGSYPIILFVS